MRTSFAKRSAPTLTERQCRRQITDLLARHLACMPFNNVVRSGVAGCQTRGIEQGSP